MPRSRRLDIVGRHGAAEAQAHQHLARFGVTGPGREWVMRALHPASEKKSPGLPDESSAFVLRPDFRVVSTITPPANAGQWDCFIWIPPGDCNALYWATAPSPCDFSTANAPAGAQVGVIQLQNKTQTDSSPTRPYITQFGAEAKYALTNLPTMRPAGFRHQFKSVTIELVAAAVADQGQVYAGQFAPMLRTTGMVWCDGYDSGVANPTTPGTNYGLIAQNYSTILPTDEESLSRMNPDFYQMPAREGVYMPLRLSGPSQPFARSTADGAVHAINNAAGFLAQCASEAPIGALLTPTTGALMASPSVIPWPYLVSSTSATILPSTPLLLPGRLLMDSGYDQMNVGVVIFRGLAGATGGGYGASLQVKVIAGLEVAPTPGQGDAVFAERPAPY